jgi:uncharacterized protein with FMN-binding domain
MKKYFLSFFLIIAFAFYVMLENQSSISVVLNSPENSQPGGNAGNPAGSVAATVPSGSPVSGSAPIPSPITSSPSTPVATGLYRDGSYDGGSVNAYFGNVQVQAVVSGGKLTDVKVLDYPKDRTTSARINNAALPKLVQEAISSQSAQVDIVSGATQTSQGFQASLTSALAKAKS